MEEDNTFNHEQIDSYLQRKIDIWTAKAILYDSIVEGRMERAIFFAKNLTNNGFIIDDVIDLAGQAEQTNQSTERILTILRLFIDKNASK